MVQPRWWFGVLFVGAISLGHAEPPESPQQEMEVPAYLSAEPPLSKPEERAKFHSEVVRGTSAADRLHAWDLTKELRKASFFEGVKWRNVGPEIQGGRIIDITAPTSDPNSLYIAYATGGLYRTEDEGETWTSLFDDQSAYGIGAIAVTNDGKTLWVGTGEANSQRTSYAGTGVFRSDDRGKTWRNMGLPESHHIAKILIDPKNPDVVYVAALGHLYSQNDERGVYKSTDGGQTWKQLLKVDQYTGAIDLTMDPSNPNVVYAAMWDRDRRAWNFRESGPGSALYRTENGGGSWSKVRGLPTGNAAGRIGLATSAANPAVVYAFFDNQDNDPDWDLRDEATASGKLTTRRFVHLNDTTYAALDAKILTDFLAGYEKAEIKAIESQADVRSGKTKFADVLAKLKAAYPDRFSGPVLQAEVYRSSDHGRTWAKTAYLGNFGGGYYWGKTFANPANADEVYVTGLPLLRSLDGGKSWKSVAEDAHVDHHAMWFDPRKKGKCWIGNDGGLYVSSDQGDHVRHVNNLSVAQSTTVAVDNQRPYNIIVGNQDNGTMRGPSTYEPGKSDIDAWKDLFGGDGSAIAVDPRDNGSKVIVSYQFGQFFVVDPTAGTRGITPRGKDKDDILRYNWIAPVVISAHNPDIVYIGSQRLHRSLDGARKWTDISGDLTKNLPNGDVPYSTLKDISESPLRFGLIYTAADDGSINMTPDGGFQWIAINTPAPKKWVSRIVASRYDVNVVYCAQSGYREDDFSAYLWRSADQGRTWTSIVGDLPAQTINVIREDTKDAKTLYIGTDLGVYVSFDAGAHWQALHGALPTAPVHDLVIQEREDDLVAATHARGAYVLPLKRIRAFNAKLLDAPITILEAKDMSRGTRWGMPNRSSFERRLPDAPKLKGSFFVRDSGPAVVRIKDATGKVLLEVKLDAVRGFNDFELSLETKPGQVPPDTIKPDPANPLADPFAKFRPEYLAAGKYTLEVQAGTAQISQAWELTAS
jgi:photosystem II stability/assembly factor-like uncharacterized protein